jgi:NADH-quinone oxidoreductase subunit A
MSDFLPLYLYFGLTLILTLGVVASSALIPSRPTSPVKFAPYESGIRTQTDLFKQRFPLRHYLVGLIFLVFDIEVIFLYPWAVVAKQIGPFAFYEMLIFLLVLLVGFIYVWRKRGLQWE